MRSGERVIYKDRAGHLQIHDGEWVFFPDLTANAPMIVKNPERLETLPVPEFKKGQRVRVISLDNLDVIRDLELGSEGVVIETFHPSLMVTLVQFDDGQPQRMYTAQLELVGTVYKVGDKVRLIRPDYMDTTLGKKAGDIFVVGKIERDGEIEYIRTKKDNTILNFHQVELVKEKRPTHYGIVYKIARITRDPLLFTSRYPVTAKSHYKSLKYDIGKKTKVPYRHPIFAFSEFPADEMEDYEVILKCYAKILDDQPVDGTFCKWVIPMEIVCKGSEYRERFEQDG